LQNNNAKTTPILRFAQEQALRVKPMLGRRSRAGRSLLLFFDSNKAMVKDIAAPNNVTNLQNS